MKSIFSCTAAILMILAGAAPARAQGFTTFDAPGAGTGTLQGTAGFSINAGGDVAGFYLDSSSVVHGFIRASDGTITAPIDAPGAGTGMAQGTYPLSLNAAGDIAGIYEDANSAEHGFLRSAVGTLTEFDVPGASTATNRGTNPLSIDMAGDITGTYTDTNSVWHGFLRAADGTITTFDAPGAGTGLKLGTQPTSINSVGVITGNYNDANSVRHGFIRAANGTFTAPIDVPGAGTSGGGTNESNFVGTVPACIDTAGDIAGVYSDTNGVEHAFVRAANGTIATFDAPGAGTTGKKSYKGTLPFNINTEGVITGTYGDTSGVLHGFIRAANGTITAPIDAPGAGTAGTSLIPGTLGAGLNDSGVITGGYFDASGVLHGFVGIPSNLPFAATPTFSVSAGSYNSTQSVAISDTTTNATIYYTTDETTPTTASNQYSSAITVASTETIEAIAVASGYSASAVATATYTITLPLAGVAPPSLMFGSQNLGTTSASLPVMLNNTGTGALSVASIVASANFGETDNCAGGVAAGSSCTINVTFSPTATGPLTGSLTVTDNSNGVSGSTQSVRLSGTGINAAATVSPTSLSFGSEVITTTSLGKKVTLTSTGTTNLIVSSIMISGANAGDFSQTNTCTAASYAPGAKCTITVTFTPSVTPPGAESATLIVTDNAATNQTVALTGTGEEPVTLTPTSLGFGNVGENSPSAVKTITLTNHQAVALNISSITLSNPDYSETDNCVGTVAAKGNCTITVTLTPTVLTADNGTLTVNDNASNSPQATLTGTGVVPAKLSLASLGFGNVPQSTAGTPKSITLTNNEAGTLNITSITTGNPDFTETDTCDGSVPAKGTCTITVTFTPSIVGAETGTLTVTDAASNSPQTAALSGTGIAQATVSPTSLTFTSQKAGTTSAAKTVTLTNNLSTALTVGAVTFTGAEAGDFASPTNTCGGSLAAKSKCTISVTFTPTATGARTATMNVSDSANNSPQTVSLTGTGK